MAFTPNSQNKQSPRNSLAKFILPIIFFPFNIRKKYLRYNAVLWEAEQEVKGLSAPMGAYRHNNTKLLNIFIHAPLALGVLMVSIIIYWQMDGFAKYAARLTDFPKISISKPKLAKNNVKHYFHQVSVAGKDVNLRSIAIAFGGCYLLSFVGAMILSINNAWDEERTIRDALISNRYVDFDGVPWKAYWTPDAIIFHTYQCDPDALANNDKFWNTINFKPDTPVQFNRDTNKIIVGRAYALPSIIDFTIKNLKAST
jgi:hypothetical protein